MGRCENLKQKFYPPDQWDNDQVFLRRIEACIRPGSIVLDLGAGTGLKFNYNLKSMVEPGGEIVGSDFDPRVRENPLLHRGVVIGGAKLPFDDEVFDVIFSRYVLEHVTDPPEFLNEVYRVLKGGGSFLFLTPNKWHYVAIGSRCTPHMFHRWYNRLRGRESTDTFPTVYRLNSRSAIRRHLRDAGFHEKELVTRECCPNYLMLAVPLFLVGVVFERVANSTDVFAGLRVNILGHFSKPK